MKQEMFKIKNKETLEYNINKAFLGIFAVVFGLVFLINNFGAYPLNVNLANIWPLFIVFIGLSLFKKKNAISTIIGSIVTIICAVLFSYSLVASTINQVNLVYQNNVTPIVITKDMNMNKAQIELNAGAGEVNVYGIDSDNLIEGKLITNIMESEISQSIEGSIQKVIIGLRGNKGWPKEDKELKNQFNIGIDKNTPLDFTFNSGGSNNNVDLSEIEAQNVTVSTGASNLSLKLGDRVDSKVVVEAGASSINLQLPDTVGVKLKVESGFSSEDLPGFSLVGDKTYQSLNYDSKEKKIDIDVSMGMASLKVDWYAPVKKNIISLYYYNQSEDKENTCDSNYVLPVTRYISESDNQIEDAINLLIKGKLTEKEIASGFFTEFPNADFKLLDSSLKNGTLTLKFNEVPGFTTGGSCRVGILATEIVKTAKQFPEVKKVVFDPESIFEP